MVNKILNSYKNHMTAKMRKLFWLIIFIYISTLAFRSVIVEKELERGGSIHTFYHMSEPVNRSCFILLVFFTAYLLKPTVSNHPLN